MYSYTLTLTGKSSELRTTYFPLIELDRSKNYVVALVQLFTYNTIANVHEGCSSFSYIDLHGPSLETITFPTGSYTVEAIADFIF